MKTEYQVNSVHLFHPWTTDLTHLRENYRKPGAKLFRREVETDGDAAVRRMAWVSIHPCKLAHLVNNIAKPALELIDEQSPPPPVKEVQVDWDTLEPIEEVPVWQFSKSQNWIAGADLNKWEREGFSTSIQRLVSGTAAIGHTRESALRNLAEMQGGRK